MSTLRLPRRSDRKLFRLDLFRPVAPLAGRLPSARDDQRLYADLAAAHARQSDR